MKKERIESAMHQLRYVSLTAVIASGLGSILMFVIGAIKTGKAYLVMFPGDDSAIFLSAKQAITSIVQAIDAFLIGLVLMIFSGGIYKLFIHDSETASPRIDSWVKVTSISQLKRSLVEMVLVIMFVRALEGGLAIEPSDFEWEHLVLPVTILMLALALKFMDLRER
jgi:uncharacterized membrane protein YqhA